MSKEPIDDDERKVFREAMASLTSSDLDNIREDDTVNHQVHNPFRENFEVYRWHHAEDTIEFSQSGSRPAAFRKKTVRVERRLDLHGLTLDEAADHVNEFINESQSAGLTLVLIVHGKGYQAPGKRATLKSALAHWLTDDPRILAFKSALPCHGGTGALYVLLRKGT